MSRMSGYFFDGSKPGGFTIQPWIFSPSFDVYQISSVCASSLPASTSSFTAVSCVNVDAVPVFGTANVTTSFGLVGVERMPTATPVLPTLVTVSTCLPLVTGWNCPVGRREVQVLRPFALDVEVHAGVVRRPRHAGDRPVEIARHDVRARSVGVHHPELRLGPRRVIDRIGGHEGDQLAVGRVGRDCRSCRCGA